MTRDDIIRMAGEAEAGLQTYTGMDIWEFEIEELERFAALIAAAEREACARLCDDVADYWINGHDRHEKMYDAETLSASKFSDAIRARGGSDD